MRLVYARPHGTPSDRGLWCSAPDAATHLVPTEADGTEIGYTLEYVSDMPILDVYTPDNECVLMGGTERNEVNYISASTQLRAQEPEVDRQPGLRPRLPSR